MKSVENFKVSGMILYPDRKNPVAGVMLRGLPDDIRSDRDGRYEILIPQGWSGTIIPEHKAFRFEPSIRKLKEGQSLQTVDFIAIPNTGN